MSVFIFDFMSAFMSAEVIVVEAIALEAIAVEAIADSEEIKYSEGRDPHSSTSFPCEEPLFYVRKPKFLLRGFFS